MHQEALQLLFKPTSVAVIGASEEPDSPGYIVMRNLTKGKFLGPVMPIQEDMEPVCGVESYRSVDTLPLTPDLAVICANPDEVPDYIAELGKRGTRGAVVMSRGEFRSSDPTLREERKKRIIDVANKHDVRVLGPNCLGFINPSIGLNASLAHTDALPGRVAFISQSDSLFTTVLDWATSNRVGFSYFISLGDRYDIHIGHVLDYLNSDPYTRAVLIYLETIKFARPFMSAARALSRNKPILVIKSGRSMEGARAAAAHSGSFLGSDDVYEAAFRRAGMLRVFDVDTLFDTAETLARTKTHGGKRLAILTNGGSPGFLATDELAKGGGRLAELSPATRQQLDEELGGAWSYWNPLVLRSKSPGEIYEKAMRILTKDKGVDAILVMHVPTAGVPSVESAEAIIRVAKKTKKIVLTNWLGLEDASEAKKLFTDAGIPTYLTPEKAIRGFLNIVQFHLNQELLMETPASLPRHFDPDPTVAREIVRYALDTRRMVLTEPEAKDVLEAYDIPTVVTRLCSDMEGVEGAVQAAEDIGFPVALKIVSPHIRRKSLAGGVALNLGTPDAVREAGEAMLKRVSELRPDAQILGFTVQQMMTRAGAHELAIEVSNDPVFGPTIRFGPGGSLVEILAKREVGLPPMNMNLAKDLITQSQVFPLLKGYKDHPPANIDAICLTLIKISQMVIDIPEIFELQIDPLYADDKGVLALDAQMHIAQATKSGADQLAIRPYPGELIECCKLKDGREIVLRPIRPEDEPDHYEFLEHVSAEDKRFRFFGNIGELPRAEMHKLTQIDYDREMAFIARGDDGEGNEVTLGVVRGMTDPTNTAAEFAILIRSDLKRLGLGRILMEKIIRYCKSRGTNRIIGQALLSNQGMSGLAKAVGFDVKKDYEDDVFNFNMYLNPS